MKDSTRSQLNSLIKFYKSSIEGIEQQIKNHPEREPKGIIRAVMGALVENMAEKLIEIAWLELGQESKRLSFPRKIIRVPIKPDYIQRIKIPEIASWIKEHIRDFSYPTKTDICVNIDDQFVCGVECKAYAENAMMKRVLIDFTLLQQAYPELTCVLFQLESFLGGDYHNPNNEIIYGSKSTHTLLSYFDVDLTIITILAGARKVKEPIHKPQFYKELKFDLLEKAMISFQNILSKWV